MTPYRERWQAPEPERPPDDDAMILWVALVISLLGLVPRLIAGGAWRAEASVALLIAVSSAALLATHR
jgi:hypothetical protein